MSKRLAALALCLILLGLCACGAKKTRTTPLSELTKETPAAEDGLPQSGDRLCDAMNSAHMANLLSDLPVEIQIRIDHGGMEETATVTDPDTIRALAEALYKTTILEETWEEVTDNYNGVNFIFSDGEYVSFSLNLKNWEFSGEKILHLYVLDNFDEFWALCNDLAEYEDEW